MLNIIMPNIRGKVTTGIFYKHGVTKSNTIFAYLATQIFSVIKPLTIYNKYNNQSNVK
jgi:hypothetical protein